MQDDSAPQSNVSAPVAPEAAEPRFELLARAIDAMEIGCTIAGADGRILYVNQADARMHGYEVGELMGRESVLFSAPAGSGKQSAEAGTDRGWLRERLNRRRDGSLFPVRLCSEIVRDECGRRVATVTLCEDVSAEAERTRRLERKGRLLQLVARLAERILGARNWHGALNETLVDLVEATGLAGAAFVPAPGARACVGEELEAIGLGDRLPEWGSAVWASLFDRLVREAPEPRVVTPDPDALAPDPGRELVAAGLGQALLVPVMEGGDLLGLIALVGEGPADPWSEVELGSLRVVGRLVGSWHERQRAELERMRQEFVATLSHELRTPLTSILGALGLLRRLAITASPEQVSELVEVALRNGERLLRLVNDLLALQNLAADGQRLKSDTLGLGDRLGPVTARREDPPVRTPPGISDSSVDG